MAFAGGAGFGWRRGVEGRYLYIQALLSYWQLRPFSFMEFRPRDVRLLSPLIVQTVYSKHGRKFT